MTQFSDDMFPVLADPPVDFGIANAAVDLMGNAFNNTLNDWTDTIAQYC